MALPPHALLEAVLFASAGSLKKKDAQMLLALDNDRFHQTVESLRASLEGHGLSLVETDKEIELVTAADAADTVKKLYESELKQDIGKASLETLAIVLYRGGATRSEIDYVRGVNSAAALRVLSMRGLVERKEDSADKRRLRYTATLDALKYLGVEKQSELPHYDDYKAGIEERVATENPE